MKTVGIIAEYNPFHNGHAYQLRKTKELTGADYTVVVISPDFVQRGEPAIVNKYVRTRMALENGADLILELPICFASGSAEYFADGAVAILNALGCVDALCFGCETDNADAFLTLAEFFTNEPESYKILFRQNIKSGMTYPRARQAAYLEYTKLQEAALPSAELISRPNNILGLEYVKALRKYNSTIQPFPIKRTGNDYHCLSLDGSFCSATALRGALRESAPFQTESHKFSEVIPQNAFHLLQKEAEANRLVTLNDFSSILHYKLLFENDFSCYLDVSTDLSDRIINLLPEYENPMQFVSLLKSRQMTEARIRRALLHILLNIRAADTEWFRLQGCASYARILGFRGEAAPLLHEIKNSSSIPLITKLADMKNILSGPALQMLTQDISASHVYQLALCSRFGEGIRSEFTRSPIIL